ncbi:RNA 2',3'-cyclic phosphodiesterase [Acidiphilium acidophilum]|uniref:RNA 2',3'-cyclic phosphodiesterase n=1 Tax=Acidiphilium acidophilum TaxID=76588 RepID=UPI002E8E6B66|nr:RNA 2',3'-cyclic phosphodiesterase [Acidiphilium acidophilum]
MRLFVALDLPWEIKTTLAGFAFNLPGARWVPAQNIHLTLRFIGEAKRLEAEEIDHALAAVRGRGFSLVLTGAGWFEKAGRVSALWIGVERNESLFHLQTKIETALRRIGLVHERRRYTPHVTLARMDLPVGPRFAEFVQSRNLYRSPPIPVAEFTLFSSYLGPDQPDYTAEVEYSLQ